MQIYQDIRESNIKKYGTESEKVLRIIINQYSDRTHFIYEILQNAEDAEATDISFHLTKDALEILHNGRPFNERDIEGVCGIANGTKMDADGTRIGHFGIGFKSVYCYTEVPQIHSGKYHFCIKNQLFPEEISAVPGIADDETYMALPFNKAGVSAEIAFKEISEALSRRITADSLLMLNNIRHVEIDIDGFENTIEINKLKNKIGELDNGTVYALGASTVRRSRGGAEEETYKDFLFFSDNKEETSAVVYQVGGDDGKQLVPVKGSRIYAYFPTAREAHQNFYIHAPFDTTPARDNFKEGAEYGKHNLKLIENICDLVTDSLIWMRDNGYLSISGLNTVFPIYEYEDTDILYGLYENSIAIIGNGVELLPTNIPGTYMAIDNICVPQASVIVDVFGDEDLHRLVSHRKYWLAKEISTEAYSDLRKFLNRNFSLKTLDWQELVLKMDASFLEQKNVAWMEKLMARIESYCTRRTSFDSHYMNVSRIPFVRTADGKHICAKDEKGHFQVYLNNHKIARYKIYERFLESEIIRGFYQNALQIPEYNVEQEAIESVIPRYKTSQVERTIRENIEDLKLIKDALCVNPSLLETLADKYIVTDGKNWYRPGDLYIRNDDIRCGFSLMRGILDIKYLSEAYFDDTVLSIKLDADFFHRIGCNATIREIQATKSEYLSAVGKYLSRTERDSLQQKVFDKSYISQKLNWAFCYEGFERLFQEMSPEKSLKIARFLNPNAMKFDIRGELVGADDQHFSGRNVDSVVAYTMIGLYLSFEKWIYINGDDEPKRPIDIDRTDLRKEYLQTKRIMDILPFKEVKNALIDFLKENIADGGELELVKQYLSRPEELVKVAKAMAKNEAREEAKKERSSIRELIQNGDRSQQQTIKETAGLEINPITEKGIQRRENNLDRILAESMDQEVYVAKGLQFASRSSNEEERQFLLAEYGGACQICGKQIIKHNGDEYFEAINIIKFSELKANLANSSRLGWNSLCLCPNCAAEYNYCSKKISSIYDRVMQTSVEADSDVPIGIQIELPEGKNRTINYSPRHFIALKEAFKIFTKNQD